jgi:parallel beta-helix repeat protein
MKIFIITILLTLSPAISPKQNVLYVGGDGNYESITQAIEDARDGDIIYIYKGVYKENIVIDKRLTIIGEDREETIIDGRYKDFVIEILKESVIKNLTVRNSGGYASNAGIKIYSKKNVLANLTIYRNNIGIFINERNNTIINCTFHSNGEGIYINSSSNTIRGSFFSHNALGIHSNSGIKIERSYFYTNGIGIYLHNSSNTEIRECGIENNNDNQGGVCLWSCQNVSINLCSFKNNGWGIRTIQSSSIKIKDSSFLRNTHSGLWILNSEVDISKCEILDNLRYGIAVTESYCKIRNCNIFNRLGLLCVRSTCDARYNWWGCFLGPSLLHTRKERIYGRVYVFPWLLERVDCGFSIDYKPFPVEVERPPISLRGLDSDSDGVPDWWERKWGYNPYTFENHRNLDPDEDGLNNVEECFTDKWGSNPFKKDIFLELDWMGSNKPIWTSKIVESFARKNISLHIDTGNLGGGEEIPYLPNFGYEGLRLLYWKYFLNNNLSNPRKGIFHYGLICDYGPARGFSFIGWDHLDSFVICAQMIKESLPHIPKNRIIACGIMHEIGHTLGLTVIDYGGIDNYMTTVPSLEWMKYRNYKSCMNYLYTYRIIDFSDGEEFNDWENMELSFFKDTHFP